MQQVIVTRSFDFEFDIVFAETFFELHVCTIVGAVIGIHRHKCNFLHFARSLLLNIGLNMKIRNKVTYTVAEHFTVIVCVNICFDVAVSFVLGKAVSGGFHVNRLEVNTTDVERTDILFVSKRKLIKTCSFFFSRCRSRSHFLLCGGLCHFLLLRRFLT